MILAVIHTSRATGEALFGAVGILLGLVAFVRPRWFYRRNIWNRDRPMPDATVTGNRIIGVIIMMVDFAFEIAALAGGRLL